MALRSSCGRRDVRLLLPVARDMMKACCPRYLRSDLEEASLQGQSDDSADDEPSAGPTDSVKLARSGRVCLCKGLASRWLMTFVRFRRKSRFDGLGMSNARSRVLGQGVQAGGVDSNKIDGATGTLLNWGRDAPFTK